MGDIKFQGDSGYDFARRSIQSAGITGKLIRWGIAKNQKQAEYIQIGVIIVALIVTYFAMRGDPSGGPAAPLPAGVAPGGVAGPAAIPTAR